MITMFSTNCPKCKVLEQKLKAKNVNFEVNTDVDAMIAMGIHSAPALKIDENPIMDFMQAIKWINS